MSRQVTLLCVYLYLLSVLEGEYNPLHLQESILGGGSFQGVYIEVISSTKDTASTSLFLDLGQAVALWCLFTSRLMFVTDPGDL